MPRGLEVLEIIVVEDEHASCIADGDLNSAEKLALSNLQG